MEALAGNTAGLAIQVSFIVVLGPGGARVASGAIDVGTLIAFLLYLYYLLPPMQGLVGAAANTRSARPRSPASAKPNSSRSNPPAPPPSRPGPAARPPRSPSSRCASATAPSCPRPTAASASLSHRVVVIDAGRVRAVGTHTELLSTDPLYAEFAATQFLVAAD